MSKHTTVKDGLYIIMDEKLPQKVVFQNYYMELVTNQKEGKRESANLL